MQRNFSAPIPWQPWIHPRDQVGKAQLQGDPCLGEELLQGQFSSASLSWGKLPWDSFSSPPRFQWGMVHSTTTPLKAELQAIKLLSCSIEMAPPLMLPVIWPLIFVSSCGARDSGSWYHADLSFSVDVRHKLSESIWACPLTSQICMPAWQFITGQCKEDQVTPAHSMSCISGNSELRGSESL